jgi:hypothetical protein
MTQPMSRAYGLVLAVFVLLVFALPASSQDLAKRLILKDGSYQSVTKYETKGDRVRYLSAERNEWEELPSSLVDWPATEKYAKDRAAGAPVPEAAELDQELEADRAADEAKLPQVAPGLHLPDDTGVFLLDTFQGQPQLIEVQQNAGDVNRNTKTNLLRGVIPLAGARQTVELPHEHAALQAHASVPSFYIKIDEESENSGIKDDTIRNTPPAPQRTQQPQQPQQALVPFDRFHIVRAEVKGGKRIVGNMTATATGKVSQKQHMMKTTISRINGGWLKLTPTEDLPPGEYAVIETMGEDGMNLYVWDFGINPNAPGAPTALKPDPSKKN